MNLPVRKIMMMNGLWEREEQRLARRAMQICQIRTRATDPRCGKPAEGWLNSCGWRHLCKEHRYLAIHYETGPYQAQPNAATLTKLFHQVLRRCYGFEPPETGVYPDQPLWRVLGWTGYPGYGPKDDVQEWLNELADLGVAPV